MKYKIGTAYHYATNSDVVLFNNWKNNTKKYAEDFFCISTVKSNHYQNEILVGHNLGHIHSLLRDKQKGLSGWSGHMVALAMLSYCAGADFVYKESDCFWYGDVVGQMYRDLNGTKMVFGPEMATEPLMSCAQATFLVLHDFIPKFLSDYLALGDDIDLITEDRFVALAKASPEDYGRLSFGVDRERPIPYDKEVWYAQQVTDEELDVFRGLGMFDYSRRYF